MTPPSALLARAVEQESPAWPATVVRVTVDILGPIPVGDLEVTTRVVRPGRSVDLVAADLLAAGPPVAQARAWRMRRAELELPASRDRPPSGGRMRYPLLAAELPAGLQRMMAIADSGSGVSHVLPMGSWMFVNTELTVHVAAGATGEWICLDASARVDPSGFGLATSRLFDRHRLVGRGAQSLFLAPA